MATVYQCHDPKFNRKVAIKVIAIPPFSTEEQATDIRQRFEREAIAAGRFSHPNIVRVYDQGEDPGYLYLVMEFVPGKNLRNVISSGPPMAMDRILGILRSIADALDHAHVEGVVHRDIKPANIMVLATAG